MTTESIRVVIAQAICWRFNAHMRQCECRYNVAMTTRLACWGLVGVVECFHCALVEIVGGPVVEAYYLTKRMRETKCARNEFSSQSSIRNRQTLSQRRLFISFNYQFDITISSTIACRCRKKLRPANNFCPRLSIPLSTRNGNEHNSWRDVTWRDFKILLVSDFQGSIL